ncbi:hypothetical protein [Chryseobacterium soldanellicola]|nr:hypothetical protein [Chryseobacterium soldanellicola]
MKKLFLALTFVVAGMMTVSAQTTPQKKTDTIKPDTTRNQRDMKKDHNNNMNNNNTTDTTGNWKSKDATTGDKKMKKKNK